MAVLKEPDTQFQKTLALNDWYLGADDWDHPLGGIQMLGKSDSDQIRGEAPQWAGMASPDLPFEVLAHHAVDFWLCTEDLPLPENRVTLDSDGDIPSPWTRRTTPKDSSAFSTNSRRCSATWACTPTTCCRTASTCTKGMPIGATAHQAGTVRFGTDPQTSALDVDCKAHDLGNLYVVDTSFFPSIGAVNPSLTAIANALRVGDHIAERLS
ncbi:GMC oxidoreductase [Streptomyces sp. NBC_01789]|uniref:GMC oxidoreductase n=1 Tax=Streptomyces sp. NBC_01789 TaxID=2975941 RepID=UPI002B1CAEA8|nr:GMC oxidoreductase [Streptomyces sp. NBC_01789]